MFSGEQSILPCWLLILQSPLIIDHELLINVNSQMPPRQQPRRISRELALLSLSQIQKKPESLDKTELNSLLMAAIGTLTAEIHEILEIASTEVNKGNDHLLATETRASNVEAAKKMVQSALELAQTAINRLATGVELPEMIQLSSQYQVREYALELIATVQRRGSEIDEQLDLVMVDWQLKRLVKVDRDILRIAVAEMAFLELPHKVAINEAVELAKRYSDEDGYRFINGVLRKVSDHLKKLAQSK